MKSALFILSLFCSASFSAVSQPRVTWTVLDVNTGLQADAHLLEFSNGKKVMIDVGDPEKTLVHQLKQRGIEKLDAIYVTHAHVDHYGGLLRVLESGITVGEVRFVVPNQELCNEEIPWGCKWKEVNSLLKKLWAKRIRVREYQEHEVLLEHGEERLEVLYYYDGVHSPVGKTVVNDMSPVMRLTVGKVRVLFTGDLGKGLGTYLAANAKGLEADILKVPHHGGESLPPVSFFDKVNPRIAIIPAPKMLWDSPRVAMTREYVKKKKVEAFVSGYDRTVRVVLEANAVSISSEGEKSRKFSFKKK